MSVGSHEFSRLRTDARARSCRAVNPKLQARHGALRIALREYRPPCLFVFEALSAGSRFRPRAVLPLRRPPTNGTAGKPIPARMAATAARHHPAPAPPALVVASCQTGERLAHSTDLENCSGRGATAFALLHSRFGRRAFQEFGPDALRIPATASAADGTERRYVRSCPTRTLGRDHA